MHKNDSISFEKGNPRSLNRLLAICLSIGSIILLSLLLPTNSNFVFLAATGFLAFVVLVQKPIIGLYIAYPILFLVPYGALRLNLPFLHSPINIIASLTLAIGIIQTLVKKRKLPKSRLYVPIIICISILGVFTLVGHGEVVNLRLMMFVEGLWPFALVILLLETPRQARNVLLSMAGTVFILSLILLPFLFTGGRFGSTFIRGLAQQQTGAMLSLPYTIIQESGTFQLFTLLALAMVATFLFSICIYSKKNHIFYWFSFIVMAGTLLASTFASVLIAFIIGMVLVLLLGIYYKATKGRSLAWISLIIMALLLVGVLLYVSPVGTQTAERILNPTIDPSGQSRLWAMQQGLGAFLTRPLMGNGAYNRLFITRSGYYLAGHNTFVVAAYEFGLLFLIPYLLLFALIVKEYGRLLRRVRKPIEKAMALGMTASFGTAIITGFITPVFSQVSPDAIVWLFIGLMTVWNNWLDENPEAELVA